MSSSDAASSKIKRIVKILKFLLTIDDIELIKTSIESISEMLEEDVKEE